jgi:subtilisin family serine protease
VLTIAIGIVPVHWASAQGVTPNDPGYVRQWGLHVTDADLAWNITTGSTQVSVGIIDTGVDYAHPDLFLNIWINQPEIPPQVAELLIDVDGDGLITFWDLNSPINQGAETITDLNGNGYIDGGDLLRPFADGGWANGLDDGGNGYIDDLMGWDFIDDDNDPMELTTGPESFHGTSVAGIIGAVGNNGLGMAGVNWRVQMMPLRVNDGGEPTPAVLVERMLASLEAAAYALDHGARVVNFSAGLPTEFVPQEIVDATSVLLAEAAANDVLLVASAGNEGVDTDVVPHFPSSLPHENVISVAATFRQQDSLAFFGDYWASNYGVASVDLGAPGDYLWTTVPLDRPGEPYFVFGGTSGATPFVSGAAALILSVNPALTVDEVKALILDGVDPAEDLEGITLTGGRLNIARAVMRAAGL